MHAELKFETRVHPSIIPVVPCIVYCNLVTTSRQASNSRLDPALLNYTTTRYTYSLLQLGPTSLFLLFFIPPPILFLFSVDACCSASAPCFRAMEWLYIPAACLHAVQYNKQVDTHRRRTYTHRVTQPIAGRGFLAIYSTSPLPLSILIAT